MRNFVVGFLLVLVNTTSIRSEDAATAELPTVIYDKPDPKVTAALDKRITLDFNETPLEQVVEFVKEFTKVNVILDLNGLDIAGVDADEPVSLSLNEIPLKNALKLLLDPLELTYIIKNDVLLITDREDTAAEPEIRIYPVIDLVQGKQKGGASSWLAEAHMDVILSTVEPDEWAVHGGIGTIEFAPSVFSFVVRASPRTHEKVEELLKLIRSARGPTEAWALSKSIDTEVLRQSFSNLQRRTRSKDTKNSGGGMGGGKPEATFPEPKETAEKPDADKDKKDATTTTDK